MSSICSSGKMRSQQEMDFAEDGIKMKRDVRLRSTRSRSQQQSWRCRIKDDDSKNFSLQLKRGKRKWGPHSGDDC